MSVIKTTRNFVVCNQLKIMMRSICVTNSIRWISLHFFFWFFIQFPKQSCFAVETSTQTMANIVNSSNCQRRIQPNFDWNFMWLVPVIAMYIYRRLSIQIKSTMDSITFVSEKIHSKICLLRRIHVLADKRLLFVLVFFFFFSCFSLFSLLQILAFCWFQWSAASTIHASLSDTAEKYCETSKRQMCYRKVNQFKFESKPLQVRTN